MYNLKTLLLNMTEIIVNYLILINFEIIFIIYFIGCNDTISLYVSLEVFT